MFDHFVAAQDPVYRTVTAKLAAGRKTSHWMWFIFPQLAGLGRSAMARRFALAGLEEAKAYLAHPVLGARLAECTDLALGHADRGAHAVFGSPDDLKFRSSMTLFHLAEPGAARFRAALDRFYDGQEDAETLRLLGAG